MYSVRVVVDIETAEEMDKEQLRDMTEEAFQLAYTSRL